MVNSHNDNITLHNTDSKHFFRHIWFGSEWVKLLILDLLNIIVIALTNIPKKSMSKFIWMQSSHILLATSCMKTKRRRCYINLTVENFCVISLAFGAISHSLTATLYKPHSWLSHPFPLPLSKFSLTQFKLWVFTLLHPWLQPTISNPQFPCPFLTILHSDPLLHFHPKPELTHPCLEPLIVQESKSMEPHHYQYPEDCSLLRFQAYGKP